MSLVINLSSTKRCNKVINFSSTLDYHITVATSHNLGAIHDDWYVDIVLVIWRVTDIAMMMATKEVPLQNAYHILIVNPKILDLMSNMQLCSQWG